MSTIKILVAAALMMCSAVVAFAADVSDTDKAQIETIIRSQMDAFQRDDDAEAFSYASPGIPARLQDDSLELALVDIADARPPDGGDGEGPPEERPGETQEPKRLASVGGRGA